MVYADNYPRETERFAVLADVVVLIHLVVVLFITAGLPLIYLGAALGWTWVRDWRWRILHLVAIAFVAAQSLFGIACPLTIWEDALRGRKPNVGFIEGWIDGILFYDLRAWVFAKTRQHYHHRCKQVFNYDRQPASKSITKSRRIRRILIYI
jgi:hypothetical protein